MDATFEEVVKLAEQLDVDQQNLLIYRLRVQQLAEQTADIEAVNRRVQDNLTPFAATESDGDPVTREALLLETEQLRQLPVSPDNHLFGKYANPNVPEMTEEEFHAQMHAIATEWEQELDEFSRDND